MKIMVTGGCGFIGHHFVEHVLAKTDWEIIIVDKLSYASMGLERIKNSGVYFNNRVKVFPIETVNRSTVPGKASTFTWKDGTNLSNLIQYGAGKVIFLNFWATWCPPCRKEIPDIIELYKEFSENEVLVLGVFLLPFLVFPFDSNTPNT